MDNKEDRRLVGLEGMTGIIVQDARYKIGSFTIASAESSTVRVIEDRGDHWLRVELLQPITLLNGRTLATGTVIEVESIAFRIENF